MKRHSLNFYYKYLLAVYLITSSFFSFSQTIGLTISGQSQGCFPLTVTFVNNSSAGFDKFLWDFTNDGITDSISSSGSIGQQMIVTFSTPIPSNYTKLTGIILNGPPAIAMIPTNIYAPNIADINPLPSKVCSDPVALINSSTILGPANHTTEWYVNDNYVGNTDTLYYSFTLPGWNHIKLVDGNMCGVSISFDSLQVIKFNPEIIIDNNPICKGSELNFENADTLADITLMTSSWNFDDNTALSTDLNPNHTYDLPGNYNVTLHVEINDPSITGCESADSLSINVLDGPVASFSDSLPLQHCDSAYVHFINTSDFIPSNDSCLWDFGNGLTSNLSTVLPVFYDSAGYFKAKLIITRPSNGCVSKDSTIVMIPKIQIDSVLSDTVCFNFPSALDAIITSIPQNNPTFTWSFESDTISGAPLPYTFTHYDLNPVSLTVDNGFCRDSLDFNVFVKEPPHAAFNADTTGCHPFNFTAFNSSTNTSSFFWRVYNNVILPNQDTLNYSFENSSLTDDTTTVELFATSGGNCTSSKVKKIIIYHSPISKISSDIPLIPSCNPVSVHFINQSLGADSFSWDIGDGSGILTDTLIDHTFINQNNYFKYYQIKLFTSTVNGCNDTATQFLTLYPIPNTNFVWDSLPSCSTTIIQFTAPLEYNGIYTWTFSTGDTRYGRQVNYEFSYTGTGSTVFWVRLTTQNQFGCTGYSDRGITIYPPPHAPIINFIPDPFAGCPDLEVSFQNLSEYIDSTTYVWDFGDGTHSLEVNPVHTYYDAGIKSIQLSAVGLDCSTAQFDTIIEVYEVPLANFDVTPEIAWVPNDPVLCSPVSQLDSIWNYFWDFGDGTTSDTMEVLHYYQDTNTTGEFTITLIVVTEHNCSDTVTKIIKAKTSGTVESPNVFFPGLGGGGGSGDGGGPVGDGDDVFAPVTEGVIEYHLEVYNRWGEVLFKSDTKEIGWTGYYHGKLCKEDVYVWKVFGKYANNVKFLKAGTITLLQK